MALVPEIFVQDAVQRKLLLVSHDRPLTSGLGYYFIHPEGEAATPELMMFREWLLAEAGVHANERGSVSES